MMIGGIILLVIVLLGVVLFVYRKNAKKAAQTVTPTQSQTMQPSPSAAMQEGSKAEEKAEGTVKTFEIDASNFKFAPNTMSVNEGDMVKITFKNSQGFHDFVLDEFNVKSKTLPTGQTEEIQFVAGKKGTFEYYCSVGNHRAMGMTGKLTVN